MQINPGGAVSVLQDVVLLTNGSVQLEGGTLDAGEIAFQGAGELHWRSGTLHVGIYHGDLLNQSGTLAPGHSAGDTLILGDYQQQSKGTLEIEIGGLGQGAQFDFINITGNALVDGELDLKLINGFVPTPSQSFMVLNANSLLGVFDNAGNGQRVTTSDGSGSFLVHYGVGSSFNQNQVILTDFQLDARLPGDANGDGKVDLADFGILKNHFGTGTTLAEGDFNGDGKVDLFDFGILKSNFGKSAAGVAAAVPEPSTIVLAVLGVALLATRFRGSRCSCRIDLGDPVDPSQSPLLVPGFRMMNHGVASLTRIPLPLRVVVPGDSNLDGKFDLDDFGILKAHFGAAAERADGDVDLSGKVDLADFGLLKANCGTSVPAIVPVSEPSIWLLAALAGRGYWASVSSLAGSINHSRACQLPWLLAALSLVVLRTAEAFTHIESRIVGS